MDPIRPVIGGTVLSLAVYPEKGAPGTALRTAQVGPEGFDGDRRKKRPVHLVGRESDPETTRANVFLDVAEDELAGLVGEEIRIGRVTLRITELPSSCPGVYADVVRPGTVEVGDRVS